MKRLFSAESRKSKACQLLKCMKRIKQSNKLLPPPKKIHIRRWLVSKFGALQLFESPYFSGWREMKCGLWESLIRCPWKVVNSIQILWRVWKRLSYHVLTPNFNFFSRIDSRLNFHPQFENQCTQISGKFYLVYFNSSSYTPASPLRAYTFATCLHVRLSYLDDFKYILSNQMAEMAESLNSKGIILQRVRLDISFIVLTNINQCYVRFMFRLKSRNQT